MQQNRTKNTGRVEAPTQDWVAKNPKYQPHGTTRTTQLEREKKKGKQKLKEKKKKGKGKQRESTGTKKGEKKRKRVDPGRGREEGKMKAWLGKSCTWYG